jgi:hypothetical protein
MRSQGRRSKHPCLICGAPRARHGKTGPFRLNPETGKAVPVWLCDGCLRAMLAAGPSALLVDEEELAGRTIH